MFVPASNVNNRSIWSAGVWDNWNNLTGKLNHRKKYRMETTKTDHSLQTVFSGIRMWNMLIWPLVVSALKREVDMFGENLTNKNNPFSINR